ncbi:hypothetical protein VTK73DRAFT_8332 [Phialemonium thermophilum]|uniref:Uncharacterized protein n=1 Tax=Phialemonium thermophilum TaxID=223376 RepID=A0ABR3Y789_9PEZI
MMGCDEPNNDDVERMGIWSCPAVDNCSSGSQRSVGGSSGDQFSSLVFRLPFYGVGGLAVRYMDLGGHRWVPLNLLRTQIGSAHDQRLGRMGGVADNGWVENLTSPWSRWANGKELRVFRKNRQSFKGKVRHGVLCQGECLNKSGTKQTLVTFLF